MSQKTLAYNAWLCLALVLGCTRTNWAADVPSVPFTKISCGPAALYISCRLLNIQVDLKDLLPLTDPENDGNCSMLALKTCAESLGLFACGLEMSLDDLASFEGIGIASTYRRSRSAHYVVVAGVREGKVLVVDPFASSRSRVEWIPMSRMAKLWTGRMLVLSRSRLNVVPGTQPSPASLSEWSDMKAISEQDMPVAPATQSFGDIQVVENPITTEINDPDKPLRTAFILSNTADSPILIENLHPCCGVAAATVPQADSIPSFGSVTIEASAVLPEQGGVHVRSILVQTKDPAGGINIPLTWIIKRPITWCEVAPGTLAFGSVVRGEVRQETITVTVKGGAGASSLITDTPVLLVQPEPSSDDRQTFTVSLNSSLIERAGWWRGKLQLVPKDSGWPGVTIEATAQISEPVLVTPKRIWFGEVACGQRTQKRVAVNIKSTRTGIRSLRSSDQSLIARSADAKAGHDQLLDIEWTPNGTGWYKGSVVIETDNPCQPFLTVPCYGMAVQGGIQATD